mmetsp:Transcript_34431/g.93280  ORF Transcript_34431/g.93280 Transcript_34431/m.93280 type:complete len:220 (-) Transcript_34431:376-1035(-)
MHGGAGGVSAGGDELPGDELHLGVVEAVLLLPREQHIQEVARRARVQRPLVVLHEPVEDLVANRDRLSALAVQSAATREESIDPGEQRNVVSLLLPAEHHDGVDHPVEPAPVGLVIADGVPLEAETVGQAIDDVARKALQELVGIEGRPFQLFDGVHRGPDLLHDLWHAVLINEFLAHQLLHKDLASLDPILAAGERHVLAREGLAARRQVCGVGLGLQ